MKSESIPIYDFILPSGKIRDATLVNNGNNIHLIVMSSQGYLYTEILNDTTKSSPFYMMNVLAVDHQSVSEADQGLINGGGTSVYYSTTLKMLFFSYSKGK